MRAAPLIGTTGRAYAPAPAWALLRTRVGCVRCKERMPGRHGPRAALTCHACTSWHPRQLGTLPCTSKLALPPAGDMARARAAGRGAGGAPGVERVGLVLELAGALGVGATAAVAVAEVPGVAVGVALAGRAALRGRGEAGRLRDDVAVLLPVHGPARVCGRALVRSVGRSMRRCTSAAALCSRLQLPGKW